MKLSKNRLPTTPVTNDSQYSITTYSDGHKKIDKSTNIPKNNTDLFEDVSSHSDDDEYDSISSNTTNSQPRKNSRSSFLDFQEPEIELRKLPPEKTNQARSSESTKNNTLNPDSINLLKPSSTPKAQTKQPSDPIDYPSDEDNDDDNGNGNNPPNFPGNNPNRDNPNRDNPNRDNPNPNNPDPNDPDPNDPGPNNAPNPANPRAQIARIVDHSFNSMYKNASFSRGGIEYRSEYANGVLSENEIIHHYKKRFFRARHLLIELFLQLYTVRIQDILGSMDNLAKETRNQIENFLTDFQENIVRNEHNEGLSDVQRKFSVQLFTTLNKSTSGLISTLAPSWYVLFKSTFPIDGHPIILAHNEYKYNFFSQVFFDGDTIVDLRFILFP